MLYLSRQLDAIFVAFKLQLENRMCKPGAISGAICRCDIAGVSNMFETWCNFSATKIASSCRNKNCLSKRALKLPETSGFKGILTSEKSRVRRTRFVPSILHVIRDRFWKFQKNYKIHHRSEFVQLVFRAWIHRQTSAGLSSDEAAMVKFSFINFINARLRSPTISLETKTFVP